MQFLKAWLPVIVWAAVILSTANDGMSNDTTAGWLERLFGDVPPVVNYAVRKSAHVVGYSILGLLAWRATRLSSRASVEGPLLVVLMVAVTDELLQSRTLTRSGSPFDVLLDLCGALLALIAVPAVRARISSRRGAG